MLQFYHRLSLQKKLLVFVMSLVLFLGSVMGIIIRFAVFPHLVHQMEERGVAVARRLAENSRSLVLARDTSSLTALLTDERAQESNIAYIIVDDGEDRMLAHTSISGAPEAGQPEEGTKSGRAAEFLRSLAPTLKERIFEIDVPVDQDGEKVATIRLGLDRRFVESIVQELRLFHLGFVGFITMLGIAFGLYLSKIIARPISSLTRLAGEISKGNLNTYVTLGPGHHNWDLMQCCEDTCPLSSRDSSSRPDGEPTAADSSFDESGWPSEENCREWCVYPPDDGDEITQLADTFNHMVHRLRSSETELRLSEQRYRLLFNHDPNPIFVIAPDSYRIIDANERASEQYGYTRDELLSMRFTELGVTDSGFDDGSAEIIGSFSGPYLEGRPCSLLPKLRHRRKTGTQFWVNAHFCGYKYVGKPAVIATTTDVTRIIDTETRLIQASKMATLGEMSAGIAHELNQPLNTIKLGSEFLLTMAELGKPVEARDLKQVAHDLSKEVDRASSIITHLREFGRKSEVRKHGVNLNVPVRGALAILGQQLRVHGIEVVLDLDEHLPDILADENRIEQVLINLIINARDALDSRKEHGPRTDTPVLTIRSYVENDRVVLSVGDNGGGIPESIRERVFEPFFTTKAVGKGTGLGLSISYGIVGDYDGLISFETEEGQGTVFKLSFPVAPTESDGGDKENNRGLTEEASP